MGILEKKYQSVICSTIAPSSGLSHGNAQCMMCVGVIHKAISKAVAKVDYKILATPKRCISSLASALISQIAMSCPVPRVIYIRHGETEWSKQGFYTGTTDLPLTRAGAERVAMDGRAAVGDDNLIQPHRVRHVYVSPRLRARQTKDLFLAEKAWQIPHSRDTVDERVREWDYGEYEGLTTKQINSFRDSQGKSSPFSIVVDGCPGGESPEDIEARLDDIIREIKETHRGILQSDENDGDILIFAHGHILRMFVHRWMGIPLKQYMPLILPAGGVGILSYAHRNINEPAIVLGSSYMRNNFN